MNDTSLKKTTYSPDSHLRNPGLLAREMLDDLVACRYLAWRLFVRNVSAQYRQTLLGYIWAFLPPLFVMGVWVFLNSQKIINVEDPGMPYPVFVLTGTVLWQTFVDALNSPLKVVTESRGMLAKINFPREALIFAGIGEVLLNFLIRILLLVAVMAWYQVPVPPTIPLVLPGVLALIILGMAFGILLTPLGILYNDIGRTVMIVTQVWFFLTPVVYPLPKSGFAATLTQFNPVTPVLTTTREWLTVGSSSQLTGFMVVTGFAIIFLIFGWLLYRIAMPHLIARIGA